MGVEILGDFILVIMVVIRELLFFFFCSFRKFWGGIVGKVMLDWFVGCNLKDFVVSWFF